MPRNVKKRHLDPASEEDEEPPAKRQSIGDEDDSTNEVEEDSNVEGEDGDESSASSVANDDDDRVSKENRDPDPTSRTIQAGIIKRVHVQNFMCHRKFTVDFCRNVNFITGQNGSGKSAILAAIQICLGAGARKTHRASNLKDMIRKDDAGISPTEAIIRVSLQNEGSDAFCPETYGDMITVERTISKAGGYNGYKLLDGNGEEQSRSKKELDAILDHLNIQVNNPVAILDQEDAKRFLTGKSEEKYKFFKKATDLARIDATYGSTQVKLDELKQDVDRMGNSLDDKAAFVEEAKRRLKEHEELDKQKAKLKEAELAFLWSFHKVTKEQCDQQQEKNNLLEAKATKRQEDIASMEESCSQDSADEENKRKSEIEDLIQKAQEKTEEKNKLEAQFQEMTVPKKQLERQRNAMTKERKGIEKSIERTQARLDEVRQQILQSSKSESATSQKMQELKAAEDRLNELKQLLPQIKESISASKRSYDEMEPSVRHAKAKEDAISRQSGSLRDRISRLESSAGDSLSTLGPNVKRVFQKVQALSSAGKFQGPVIGPVAHYIKVAAGKEKYAAIAEKSLGRFLLDRFIVTSDADRMLLQRVRKENNCKGDCGILQTKACSRYRVNKCDIAGVETVFSVLNIENDLVFNTLVDNADIDKVALCDSKESSEKELYYQNEHGGGAIRGNIRTVYYLPQGDSWTVKKGNKADFSDRKPLRQTLGVDKSQLIAQAKEEKSQLDQDLQHAREEYNRLEHEHTKHMREWNQAKREMRTAGEKMDGLTSRIEELKADIDSASNIEIDTTEQERDVQDARLELEDWERRFEKTKEEILSLEPGIQQVKEKIDKCSSEIDKIWEETKVAEETLTQFLEGKSQREGELEKKRQKLAKTLSSIEVGQEQLREFERDNAKALEKARTVAYRMEVSRQMMEGSQGDDEPPITAEPSGEDLERIEIPDPETIRETKYYEAKIDKIKEKIRREKEKRKISKDDKAAATEKYNRAMEDYLCHKSRIEEIQSRIEELDMDLKKRVKLRGRMEEHLENFTDWKFKELLRLNNFQGGVSFDHENETLDLKVSKSGDKNSASKDVKNLSGGEKSYTQMCLILSLGEKLETPFRVLDEFDVFLDGPTRKLTIQMLIYLAQQKMAHRQFIFITPQDISDLKPGPQLKVLRLQPPQRRHNVGALSQQVLDF